MIFNDDKTRLNKLILNTAQLILAGILIMNMLPVFYISFARKGYLCSTEPKVVLYDSSFSEAGSLPRGTEVRSGSKTVDDKTREVFIKVKTDGGDYYVSETHFTTDIKAVAPEKTMYVRTPVTVYKEYDSSEILTMAKKGSELEIIDFDSLTEGVVDIYTVKTGEQTGYVYGKYLVTTYEAAMANYDAGGLYAIHAAKEDRYGGGSGGDCDYYPYAKPSFENNVMPNPANCLYLCAFVLDDVDSYIELAKAAGINAFVVDIKDEETPAFPAQTYNKYSPTNFANAYNSYDSYKNAVSKLKDAGFYVIGRITAFKDTYYVMDHPENAICAADGVTPYRHLGSYWPSAFSRSVWEYNVSLAQEAVLEMGFNEIQFDYTRFPDYLEEDESAGLVDMKNNYGESKAQALQGFVMYACDRLHELGVYVSVDVFGECAYDYVTAYGQYWSALSNVADVISAMSYPDHFSKHEFGIYDIVWTVPYELMYNWASYANDRQTEIPTPAVARTWIQAYDAIEPPYNYYGREQVLDQINGLNDAGLTGGYMPWNAGSDIGKYYDILGM